MSNYDRIIGHFNASDNLFAAHGTAESCAKAILQNGLLCYNEQWSTISFFIDPNDTELKRLYEEKGRHSGLPFPYLFGTYWEKKNTNGTCFTNYNFSSRESNVLMEIPRYLAVLLASNGFKLSQPNIFKLIGDSYKFETASGADPVLNGIKEDERASRLFRNKDCANLIPNVYFPAYVNCNSKEAKLNEKRFENLSKQQQSDLIQKAEDNFKKFSKENLLETF